MLIKIKINNHKCVIDKEYLTSGSYGVDGFKVEFSEQWKGFTKTAIMYINEYSEDAAVKYLMIDDTIPANVVPKIEKASALYIGIFGDKDGQRITSNMVRLDIDQGTFTDGTEEEIEPDIYNQIIYLMQTAVDVAYQVQHDAESGKFNGNDGAK